MITQLELLDTPTRRYAGTPTRAPDYAEDRDRAMAAIIKHAGAVFREKAIAFTVKYLKERGRASGEDISDACIAAGIKPHDERAFGPVFSHLSKTGRIEKCGTAIRRKGHGTSGAHVWRLKEPSL